MKKANSKSVKIVNTNLIIEKLVELEKHRAFNYPKKQR
jgi:hypothetical protein